MVKIKSDYKLNAIDLNIKVNKLYTKLKSKKSFNKEKFEQLLSKLAEKYNKKYPNSKLYVTLEDVGYGKHVRGLATSLGTNTEFIHSIYGKIGTIEEMQESIVHEGMLTCDDLEYNYNVIQERNSLQAKSIER